MNMKQIIIFLMMIFMQSVQAVDFLISSTGIYNLGSNLYSSPSVANDTAIQITSSDVILDLGGLVVQQTGGSGGEIGISVSSGLKNVTIRNGTILAMTGTGIVVNQNCTNILIQNVQCIACQVRGIEFLGASGNQIVDSQIVGCEVLQCASNTSVGDLGIILTQCTRTKVASCIINNSGNTTLGFNGMRFSSCNNCDVSGISVLTNRGPTITCFDIVATTSSSFSQCIGRNNPASAGVFRGFNLSGASTAGNIFSQCTIAENSATTGLIGIRLQANSQDNFLQDCIVLANSTSAGALSGFELSGGANTINNTLVHCFSQNNNAVGGDCYGFEANSSDFNQMLQCVGSFNTSTAVAVGFNFTTGTGGSSWYIQNSAFNRNAGSSNANSFGIRVVTGANTAFVNNVAFYNGTTVGGALAGNQLNGVAAGSTSSVGSTTLNTNRGYTNIAMTP